MCVPPSPRERSRIGEDDISHTVLLVDDEPNVLDGLTRVLRKEPYEILTANSAEEAATLLEDRSVDLIVSDEEMPGLSGTEFLGRAAQQYPDTVRLVLTGHGRHHRRHAARDRGNRAEGPRGGSDGSGVIEWRILRDTRRM